MTPPGEGGIGIIALAGAGAARLLDRVFVGTRRGASELPLGAIAHGTVQRQAEVVDEVIVARLQAEAEPRFEVNCHGGIVAVRAVLRCLEEAGARVVDPSQFMPRARRGGPLSPSGVRERALAALPHALTRLGAAMLLHQAGGALGDEVGRVCHLLDAGRPEEAAARLDAALEMAPLGRALLNPPKVALLGPPNVGKSTLLNALLHEERVIVHHEPGTTRDVVAETVSLGGVPFELMDSAGIRATDDDLERMAVDRAADLAARCDVALVLFDARDGPGGLSEVVGRLRPDARRILAANKCDLLKEGQVPPWPGGRECAAPPLVISARTGANLDRVESALLEPYAPLIGRCREGAPVPFDAAAREALQRAHGALLSGGPDAARCVLRELSR